VDDAPDPALAAHRFSQEAFRVAKAFCDAEDVDGADVALQEVADLQPRLAEVAAAAVSVDASRRADVNRTLADARLDLAYVLARGEVPTSTRLFHYLQERDAASN
jgi:hypothetical protein